MIRDFLAAGLIDHLHIVVVPILLGQGDRLGRRGLETPGRGRLLGRSHPHDVHPYRCLNRLGEADRTP